MRVSTSYQYDSYSKRMSESKSKYFEAQTRVATGKKYTKVSEDPIAALSSLNAKSLRSRLEQLTKNLIVAQEYTGVTEGVLAEVGQLAQRSYVLALQGASDSTTQPSRDAMATEIESIQKRLADLGNTQGSGGKYIFSGQSSDTKPFAIASGVMSFSGDVLPVNVEVRPGETMRANLDNADTFFGDMFNTLETLKTNLRGGNIQLISDTDVANLQIAIDTTNVSRGQTGVKFQEIQRLRSEGERRVDELTVSISDNEDIDLADAITQMQQAETAYTAALQVAGQGFRLSLMDFLR